jgi:preprotein translocase subunit SecY
VKDWNWRKALTWAGAIAFVYAGSHLTLWGVNAQALIDFERRNGTSSGGFLGLYELVFRGGLHRAAVLGVGIMPYLTARVYMSLARTVSPKVVASKTKTRALTCALSLIQGYGFATFLQGTPGVVVEPGPGFIVRTVLTVTAASLMAMWFAERLTERDEDDAPEVSGRLERPSGAPALSEPAQPASPLPHPRSSSARETARTR